MSKKKVIMLAKKEMLNDHGLNTVDIHLERDFHLPLKELKTEEIGDLHMRPVFRNGFVSL